VWRFIKGASIFGYGLALGAGVLLWVLNTTVADHERQCAVKGKTAVIAVPSLKWKCIGDKK
jgi:hypothetical protein